MEKKTTSTFALFLFVVIGCLLPLLMSEGKSTLTMLQGMDNSEWVHYSEKEATSSSPGIREYWVRCGGEYQFTAPSSSNVRDSNTYDTSGFTAQDPRYIFYKDDSLTTYYREEKSNYDFSKVGSLAGYTPSSIPTALGEVQRVKLYKDDFSPMYSVSLKRVSDTISSNEDLKNFQARIDASNVEGYYVLTNDLEKPTSYVTKKATTTLGNFSGTFDGEGHTINNPVFWGYRMLGSTKNALIKDLKFSQIKVFSIIAFTISNTTIDNCEFITDTTLNTYSNIGLICDIINGNSVIKNTYVDYRDHCLLSLGTTKKYTYPVASSNNSTNGNAIFENFTIRCLSSTRLFASATGGRSLRPTVGVTYVSPQYFISNGTLNYDIKYLENNNSVKVAAEYLKNTIKTITGKVASLSTFSATTNYPITTSSIIIGSDSSLTTLGLDLPTTSGDYCIKTIGKAIFINSTNDSGYQTAVNQFLSIAFKYDHLATGFELYTLKDKNNVDIFCDFSVKNTPFKYRKGDWGDASFANMYAQGYNVTGYTDSDIFFDVPACPGETSYMGTASRYHTLTMLLYPGTYYSSHKKWYAVKNKYTNAPYDLTNGSYMSYQLCFTARGDTNEYNAMVDTMVANIISAYNNRTNKNAKDLNLSIADNHNYCKCTECERQTNKVYGAISGTMIKFINDVNTKVVAQLGEGQITLSTMAYIGYKDPPVVSGEPTIESDVPIMLAPIEANFTYPLNNTTYNSTAYNFFENWAKVGKLYTWLYNTNFAHYLFPYNSFSAIPETIKYMATKGVELAYVQGQHNLRTQYRTGFNQLKVYLNGKFMQDPNSSYSTLVHRFFVNYFGEGYAKMRTFFDQMVARMSTFDTDTTKKNAYYANNVRSVYGNVNSAVLWDKTELQSWVTLCNEAYAMTPNSMRKKFILAESIFPRFCLITTFANTYSSSELLALRQAFKTDANALGITAYNENIGTSTMESLYSSWGI